MTVVAIVGGGVYAPTLCAEIARALGESSLAVRLASRDPARRRLIAHEADLRARASHPTATVTEARSLDEAFEGADHVILLVRVGGLAAREYDESFPREYGLIGDEGLGAGGISNAWRTLPTLAAMAATLRARAPKATVWNLVAPLGITTRCLLDAGLDAVGVCELPLVTRERWGLAANELGYAGLNHLGWFWPRTDRARTALETAAGVDRATVHSFGAAPLRYYYELFDAAAAERLGVTRKPGRAQALATMTDEALGAFETTPGAWVASRATPWFDRALVPMIAAREGREPWTGYVNMRNTCHSFAKRDAVVEHAATVDREGVHPAPDTDVPAVVERWLTRVACSEDLAYRAARDRDPGLLRDALAALPVEIGADTVERLAEAIERANHGGAAT